MSIICKWRQARRYRIALRDLNSLDREQMAALWITPSDIPHLAEAAASSY